MLNMGILAAIFDFQSFITNRTCSLILYTNVGYRRNVERPKQAADHSSPWKSVIWGPLQTQVHEYPISWQPRFRHRLQSLGTQVESTQTMVALRGFIWLRCEYVLRCVNEAHTALRWDISQSRLVVTNQNQREIDGLSVHSYKSYSHRLRRRIRRTQSSKLYSTRHN